MPQYGLLAFILKMFPFNNVLLIALSWIAFLFKKLLFSISTLSLFCFKKYNIGNITLDHLTSVWTLPAADTSKAEIVIPFHSTCQTLTFKSVSLTLKKKNSSQQTNVENGNLVLKSVLLQKIHCYPPLIIRFMM